MNRREFLHLVHERLQPRSYLEIGIRHGEGLAQSKTRTIGVDPDFEITRELACDLQLVKATSDDFYARPDPVSWFPERIIDLTFIDGMHLFEYALRDFMNAERLSAPASVVIFDDVLPRSVVEASRKRCTAAWTGDTYKISLALEQYRPDLTVVPIDTEPTGLLLVGGLDRTSTVLTDRYDEILATYAAEDPQPVPDVVLHRQTAADPHQVANSRVWEGLVDARQSGAVGDSLAELRSMRSTAQFQLAPPTHSPWPPAPLPRSLRPLPRLLRRANPGLERRVRSIVVERRLRRLMRH